MTRVSATVARTNRAVAWGAVLLVLAAAVYFFTVLNLQTSRTRFYDLEPAPDAAEYFVGAISLRDEGRFAIPLAGKLFPPRYPPGFSAVVLPFLYLPMEDVAAPFVANRVLAAALLASLGLVLWRSGRPIEAGLAVLLLASHPAFILLARSSMSELTSAMLVLSGFFGIYRYLRYGSLQSGCVGALILGLSLVVRVSNLFWLPILVAAPLAAPFPVRRRFVHLALFVICGLVAVAPLLAYDWKAFGSPVRTGYHLWVPYAAQLDHAFNPKFVFGQLDYWWNETLQRRTGDSVAGYFGSGLYWSPTFPFLCIAAALFHARRRWFRVFLAVGVFYVVVSSLYFYRDGRLLFSLFPLATPAIAVTLGKAIGSGRRWLAGAALAALVCQVFAFPGPHMRSALGRYRRVEKYYAPAYKFQLVKELSAARGAAPVLVLTDLNPPYVHALMGGPGIVSPLNDDHDYRFNRAVFVYGAEERQRQITEALKKGWEVWGLLSRERGESIQGLAPAPRGFEWVDLRPRQPWKGEIARLERK